MGELKHEVLSVSDTAVAFAAAPQGANYAFCTVEDDDLRVRYDGTAPTIHIGLFFAAGDSFEVCGLDVIDAVYFIRTDSGAAELQIAYGQINDGRHGIFGGRARG